jgi:Ca2+/Na+ antiporter
MKVLLDVIGAAVLTFFGLTLAIWTGRPRLWAGVTVLLLCAAVYFSFKYHAGTSWL